MLYYETKDRSSKRIGAGATVLYVAVWVALMFLVSFDYNVRETGEGILIDFGDTDDASGTMDPADLSGLPDVSSTAEIPGTDPENWMTQDFEEAPEINVNQANENPVVSPEQQRERNSQASAERQVNQQALFPGRTEGSTSTSEGTGTGTGNQGSPDGSPSGSHDGSGAGAGGTGFDLAGRSVLGSLPAPVYGSNKSGRVVVEITVDAGGVVVNATFRARGSTTNDTELVSAAIRAARQSRFNSIQGDGLQTGTITYNFRLK